MTPSPSSTPTLIGLKPGSLIPGWRVFPALKATAEPSDDPTANERAAALAARYQGVTIDVRRLPRATFRRFAQRVALAASGWDDIVTDPKTREERLTAAAAVEALTEELLQVYRELLLEPVAAAGEGALCLATVHGITVRLVGGETVPISKLAVGEQVDLLNELGLLDEVGRAAMKAQSLEEYHLRL
jgi:hypothetical protein